jgi:hypothetical protein
MMLIPIIVLNVVKLALKSKYIKEINYFLYKTTFCCYMVFLYKQFIDNQSDHLFIPVCIVIGTAPAERSSP